MGIRQVLMLATRLHEQKKKNFGVVRHPVQFLAGECRSKQEIKLFVAYNTSFIRGPSVGYRSREPGRYIRYDVTGAGCPRATEEECGYKENPLKLRVSNFRN